MSTFAYSRASRLDQTTENQRLEIDRAGFKPDYWFCDEGVSGSSAAAQRPQFRELLAKIRDGETLVVTKLDRLGRDAQDVAGTIKALTKRRIAVIVIQLGKVDLTSAPGRLLMTMLAAVAEMERDLLIERTRAGLERAKSQGKKMGRPAKTTPQQRAEMTRLYANGQGESISALARMFKISRSSVLAVVKKPQQAPAAPVAMLESNSTPKPRHGARKAAKATGKPAAASTRPTRAI